MVIQYAKEFNLLNMFLYTYQGKQLGIEISPLVIIIANVSSIFRFSLLISSHKPTPDNYIYIYYFRVDLFELFLDFLSGYRVKNKQTDTIHIIFK